MTGLSAQDNYLYLGSRSQNRVYRYTMPTIYGRVQHVYFNGYNQTRDIAITPDTIVWVASDNVDFPARGYDRNGVVVDYIDAALVSSARGVAIDPDGYLWLSNMDTDEIYKIDLAQGIETSDPENSLNITLSSNPFLSSVVIAGEGFVGNSEIAIYDIQGHLILQDSFDGSYTWDGSSSNSTPVPSGAYFAVVVDNNGNAASAKLLRL